MMGEIKEKEMRKLRSKNGTLKHTKEDKTIFATS